MSYTDEELRRLKHITDPILRVVLYALLAAGLVAFLWLASAVSLYTPDAATRPTYEAP